MVSFHQNNPENVFSWRSIYSKWEFVMNSGSSERKIKFVSISYVKSHANPIRNKTTQQVLSYTSNCKMIQSLSAASSARWATAQCNLGSNLRRKEPRKNGQCMDWSRNSFMVVSFNSAETRPLPLLFPGQPPWGGFPLSNTLENALGMDVQNCHRSSGGLPDS